MNPIASFLDRQPAPIIDEVLAIVVTGYAFILAFQARRPHGECDPQRARGKWDRRRDSRRQKKLILAGKMSSSII